MGELVSNTTSTMSRVRSDQMAMWLYLPFDAVRNGHGLSDARHLLLSLCGTTTMETRLQLICTTILYGAMAKRVNYDSSHVQEVYSLVLLRQGQNQLNPQ